METLSLPTLSSMEDFAQKVARALGAIPGRDRAYLIALSGELGAGKTTFVQGLARALGVTHVVQSPTFVLAKTYDVGKKWPKRMLHIDAYRLEGFDALRPLRWEEEVKDAGTLIVLEWPECVAPLSPSPDLHITFIVSPDGGREARIVSG